MFFLHLMQFSIDFYAADADAEDEMATAEYDIIAIDSNRFKTAFHVAK